MKGEIGTQTSGNSRKVAVRANLGYLIKARDILTILNNGEQGLPAEVITYCHIATTTPSFLEHWQGQKIDGLWLILAESGKLKGIRGKGFLSRTNTEYNINQALKSVRTTPLSPEQGKQVEKE